MSPDEGSGWPWSRLGLWKGAVLTCQNLDCGHWGEQRGKEGEPESWEAVSSILSNQEDCIFSGSALSAYVT